MVWYSHLFKNFLFFVIHTIKSFSIVYETETKIFFWNSLAFSMIQQMLVISSLSGFLGISKFRLYIWTFLAHVLLKPSLKDFEHEFAIM